jgi:hypothetical protein
VHLLKLPRSVILIISLKFCSNLQRSFLDTESVTHSANRANLLVLQVMLSTTTKLSANMLGDYSNHSILIRKS